jgi:hypothetical protein
MLSMRRSSSSSKQERTALAILVFARRLGWRAGTGFTIERKSGFIFFSDKPGIAAGATMRCGTAVRPQLFGERPTKFAVNFKTRAQRVARPRKRCASGVRGDCAVLVWRLV